ncbi:hypothetical protein KIW84_055577 [Lathyrus oleraceus]|uniref:H(+)-exporting diphosphatase n=1 Tax=Pisum sativum TaxID=3888 RepID=A0A9D4WX55_PEA|nr:hypothetical protein KIW84_055577 [Pisum sativum]
MMCGSSALPQPVMQEWESITGHHLLERDGMTEFVMALSNPLKGERKAGTVGKPLLGMHVKILADEEHESEESGIGELCVKSPSLFTEYYNLPEDDPRNPAVIADNVGDIAGMGSNLFGAYVDLLACLLTTLFATDFFEIKLVKEFEPALKNSIVVSTVLMTGRIAIVNWLIIGFVTEYYTGDAYSPMQDVADSCRTGAATNVIFVLMPCMVLLFATLGMLNTIAIGVAIDAYGPISDNAGVVAEMAGMSHKIHERTDALDAAGNTTAAIGKGFAIGYAALVSLALFGAFVSHAGITTVDVLTPKVFIGLIVGAMLSYWFSDLTMKSVGSAALKMVEKVCRQFNTILGLMEGTAKPDYATCATITTSDPGHGSCLYLGSFGNKNSTFGNFTAPLMNSNSDSSAYNIHSRKLRIKSLLMVTGFLILGVVLL